MIADAYPAPKVPLNADNAVDLEQLGSNNLVTHVWFPGIDTFRGSFIYPNWRGCTVNGDAGDYAGDVWPIDATLTPEGLPIDVPNALLKSLDQGYVFYSYSLKKVTEPNPEPESKRAFFYVGKRTSQASILPAPQIQQAHEQALDPSMSVLPPEGVRVSVPPYAAMAKGDKVTLEWRGFEEGGRERPLNPFWDVTDADVGRPLTVLVGRNQVSLIENGRVELRYRIVYAGNGEASVSAQQTISIVAPPPARLPAPTVDENSGGPLDPEHFPRGATVRIALHPQAQVGDMATLYAVASGDTSLFVSVRLDASTLDSGTLTMLLPHAWLLLNNSKRVALTYQFSRVGSVLSGEPLELLVRQPLELSLPIMSDTTQEPEDEEYEGTMDAGMTTTGSRVTVPTDDVVGETDTIQICWGEPGTPGHSLITTPVAGNWRAFDVPKNAIATHMGAGVGQRERLEVFYRVTPNGEPPESYQDSEHFFLKILPFPKDRFPIIQCQQALGTGGILSLAEITDPKGTEYRLPRWAYIHAGQILNIQVFGKEHYLLKDHRVTETEAGATYISAWLLKTYLQTQVGIGNKFKVSVKVSFDEGRTALDFTDSTELTLRA